MALKPLKKGSRGCQQTAPFVVVPNEGARCTKKASKRVPANSFQLTLPGSKKTIKKGITKAFKAAGKV